MPHSGISPFEIDMFVDHLDGPVEVTDGVYYYAEFSGVTAFETEEGLVLVDTGLEDNAPALAETIRTETDQPVDTVVYTHGHLDHAFGLEAFLLEDQSDPRVIAHENMPARFDRYERTSGHNEAINARQFGGTAAEQSAGDGESQFRWPEYPPTICYRDELTLDIGGLTFEVRHSRGETDDHSWVYCPEKDVLCTGDFHINVAPNPGNPQKVQRYPEEWAETLREMAALAPHHLCPGHGEPVVDAPDEIQNRLGSSAEYLESIVEQTIDALNDGSPPHVDIIHEVDAPDCDAPWLAETYDESEFIARNVIRRYGGWWSGRPSELKPAPRERLASELASLAGGADVLADRALALADEDVRLSCHLADFALEAAPGNESVQAAVAEIYRHRASEERNLMSGNLYAAAAAYASEGRPFR